MFLTEWKIIVSLNLIVSSVCSPDCEFEFPDLRDKTRVTSSGDRKIIVKFKVAQPCISSTKNLIYLIGKEESRGVRSNCVLRPADEYCQGDCKCPEDGSGVYSLELPPDPTYNGTWRWSSKPHVVRDHRMDIIIQKRGLFTDASEQTKDLTPPQPVEDSTAGVTTIEGQKNEPSFLHVNVSAGSIPLGATVAVGVSAVVVLIVSVTMTAVCRFRHSLKAKACRRPRVAVRDLYRGSNVSMMIRNELYAGCDDLPGNRDFGLVDVIHRGNDTGSHNSLEEGDYAEIDSFLRQSVVSSDRPSCRPPPVDDVRAAEVRRNKIDQNMFV